MLDAEPRDPPDLAESVRQLGESGRASLKAAADASATFRKLIAADVSLARSAFGRTLALTGVAIVLGAVAGLLVTAALVVLLSNKLGLPWTVSLLLVGVVCLALAALAGWRAMRYFEHTRLQATRRQLARLGIGELADHTPDAGSAVPTKAATEQVKDTLSAVKAEGAPVTDEKGIEITPP